MVSATEKNNQRFESQFLLVDSAATELMGACIAKTLQRGDLVFLVGDLGAGKTTLVRGLLRQMGVTGSTKSPTYTLVEPYKVQGLVINHFDLYRLADPEELEYIGIDDYLADEDAINLIEWPEKGGNWLPQPQLRVELSYHDEQRRIRLLGEPRLTESIKFDCEGESSGR